ncbi:MAG TPA: MBL fold metallo-hydrolase [Bryobacteraceae bacterium]
MKLTFYGAAGQVTGSMHHLESQGQRYLLDCGMYQGRRKDAEEQNRHFPFKASSIDAVLISHAHIDHTGILPLLRKNGFAGPIYATAATADLCNWMLRDTAHILESDADFLSRRGHHHVEPLFSMADAEATLPLFHPVNYHSTTNLNPALTVETYDAGHMLGSACLVLRETQNGQEISLAFSGDVGRPGLPIVRDPEPMPPVDYLIMECTYGDRLHDPESDAKESLRQVVDRTVKRGGRVIVPCFAVGRTQQVVLLLHQLFNEKRLPSLPIFVDSPLAVNVTKVFRDHPECYDEGAREFLSSGEDPFGFSRLKYVREAADSKKLNTLQGSFIVISPSGMCEVGRILHHLRNNVGDARNTVLITGFQAENTLGRKLVDGNKEVRIFGETVEVRAEIANLQALSGHADRDELLAWLKPMTPRLKKIFLVHGEPDQSAGLITAIRQAYGIEAVAAHRGQTYQM